MSYCDECDCCECTGCDGCDECADECESCGEYGCDDDCVLKCEQCNGFIVGEHFSDDDCNETGRGVVLCTADCVTEFQKQKPKWKAAAAAIEQVAAARAYSQTELMKAADAAGIKLDALPPFRSNVCALHSPLCDEEGCLGPDANPNARVRGCACQASEAWRVYCGFKCTCGGGR